MSSDYKRLLEEMRQSLIGIGDHTMDTLFSIQKRLAKVLQNEYTRRSEMTNVNVMTETKKQEVGEEQKTESTFRPGKR